MLIERTSEGHDGQLALLDPGGGGVVFRGRCDLTLCGNKALKLVDLPGYEAALVITVGLFNDMAHLAKHQRDVLDRHVVLQVNQVEQHHTAERYFNRCIPRFLR